MTKSAFPALITQLPEADILFEGVRGWISQATDHQIVFLDIEPIGQVSPHSHGEQWGIVVDGEMDLTIGGKTGTYRKGDSYFIPAGVVHTATFRTAFRAIDVFADAQRYKPK